ncbi:MAG TPA: hypothetical protein VFV76_02030 [Actinomycetes bacterium]|nr:hypothetical protein [Actinomycetes bacterium]
MSLTTQITRSKPFYVVAGAGDLAVKTIRELPAQLASGRVVAVKIGRKDVEKAVTSLRDEAVALPGKAQAAATTLPAKAQTAVVGAAVEVADRTDAVYGDLLTRGRRVVGRIRRQKATQDLKRDAGTTVRRTKAATTTAKKGAAETTSAAKGTSTTAKKSAKKATRKASSSTRTSAKRTTTTARKRAAATRTATRSASTAARKTASSAAKATTDGAAKVGR